MVEMLDEGTSSRVTVASRKEEDSDEKKTNGCDLGDSWCNSRGGNR